MIVTMIFAIILVQAVFMILSAMSSPKIFNLCDHIAKANPKRDLIIRILCGLAGPFVPVIILANYIFYREQEHAKKRELQTHGAAEFDLGIDPETEAQKMSQELKEDPEDDATKVSLFRQILKFRYQARLNKRYYSYYRVVQATMESFVVLTVLLLIMVVAPAPNRLTRNKRNLWNIVAEKLAEFLGYSATQDTLLGTLNLTNSIGQVSH